MSKTHKTLQFIIHELQTFMERMEAKMDERMSVKHSDKSDKSDSKYQQKDDQRPDAGPEKLPDDQPYSPATVPVDAPAENPAVELNTLDIDPDAEKPEIKEAGVQPAPLGDVSPLTVDGAHPVLEEQDTKTENFNKGEDMIIKSTDGIGPDIEVSDAVNSIAGSRDDGKSPDEATEVDTKKINLPTPIGSQAAQSVNGPVQDGSDDSEGEPAGDASPVQLPEPDQRPVQMDLDPKDREEAKPMPPDENAQPLANTKVESTFTPKTFTDEQPVLSEKQPEAEKVADLGLDAPSVDSYGEPEEGKDAFPSSETDEDKEIAPAPLGDDASPSNAAAPSSIVKDADAAETPDFDATAVIDKSEAPSTTDTDKASEPLPDQQPVADDSFEHIKTPDDAETPADDSETLTNK